MMRCSRIQDEELTGQKMEFLYGEADAAVRARVEVHLAECTACREEMVSLERLRRKLRAWTIEEHPRSAEVPRRRGPGWLPFAAALLLGLGVGLALLGYESVRRELVAQEARVLERERLYQEEISALRAALERRGGALDTAGLMKRVDETVEDEIQRSERRQRQQLQAALTDWSGEMEARRRLDLARMAAGLSYLDGQQGQQLARTNELMGYVLEATAQER